MPFIQKNMEQRTAVKCILASRVLLLQKLSGTQAGFVLQRSFFTRNSSFRLPYRKQVRDQHGNCRGIDQIQPEDRSESACIDQCDDRCGQKFRKNTHVRIFQNLFDHIPGISRTWKCMHQDGEAEPCQQQVQKVCIFFELQDRHSHGSQNQESQQGIDEERSCGVRNIFRGSSDASCST